MVLRMDMHVRMAEKARKTAEGSELTASTPVSSGKASEQRERNPRILRHHT